MISHSDFMNLVCELAEILTIRDFDGDESKVLIETEFGTAFTDEAQEVFDNNYDYMEWKISNTLRLEFDSDNQVWNQKPLAESEKGSLF